MSIQKIVNRTNGVWYKCCSSKRHTLFSLSKLSCLEKFRFVWICRCQFLNHSKSYIIWWAGKWTGEGALCCLGRAFNFKLDSSAVVQDEYVVHTSATIKVENKSRFCLLKSFFLLQQFMLLSYIILEVRYWIGEVLYVA